MLFLCFCFLSPIFTHIRTNKCTEKKKEKRERHRYRKRERESEKKMSTIAIVWKERKR
jgi:hypothetical protein